MTARLLRLILAFSLFGLAACESNQPQTEYIPNPGFDLRDYKTYAWTKPPMILAGELVGAGAPMLADRVKVAIEEEMKKKGYVLVPRDKPHDMKINFIVGTHMDTVYSSHNYSRNRFEYDTTYIWTQANDVQRGAISIIVTNPDNANQIYWQGSVQEDLKNSARPGGQLEAMTRLALAEVPRTSR